MPNGDLIFQKMLGLILFKEVPISIQACFWLLILTFTLLIEIEKKKQALKNEVSWICVRHSYC
jgi:hypothetical protein